MTDLADRITTTVARLQKEVKCGICCSTYKDPILSTCFHMFCRSCINSCFERKRKVQCPICRTTLDKRSCRDAYQVTMAVQNYLKLSDAFKKDIADMSTFNALPPEKMFVESQMPLDITIIPENDGKRCAPEFAIPLLPVRKRRQSKPKPEPVAELTDQPTSSTSSAVPEPIRNLPQKFEAEIVRQPSPSITKKDVEVLTNPYKISLDELKNLEVFEHINMIRESFPELDEIDALFHLIPSMRPLLEKNIEQLMQKMGVKARIPDIEEKENVESNLIFEKTERRVSFVSIPTPGKSEIREEVKISSEPPKIDDDDEIVEDSEGEERPEQEEGRGELTADPISGNVDADRTVLAVQDDESRIDEELSYVPKTIVCSRIHNDEDEVELLSDFYHKFLSNACRFSEEVNSHTTHLVMMNSEDRHIPQRSTAYLQAIAHKCIIVSRQWLVDCLHSGLLLSEANYTITSCSTNIPSSLVPPEIGWLRARNDVDGKLFSGCRFMILRKFTINPYFDYKQLIELVQLCGGEILSSYENLSPEKLFIIFSKHSKAIGEARNMEEVYKCDVVTIEWVLDSISEYSILPRDGYKAVEQC